MGQLATCHLPHTLGQALHSCCTVVCLAIESALSYLPKGGKGARGRGRLNRWAPLATRLSSAQAGSSSLPHNEVGTMPQIEAGSYPSPPSPSLSPAWHDKTIEYLWALAEQIMRQGLSCHCELPPPFGRANEMQFGL